MAAPTADTAYALLTAPESTGIGTLSLFGCRSLGGITVETLLRVCGKAVRSLDLNGAIATESVTEASLRQACPGLEHLGARGRARKH